MRHRLDKKSFNRDTKARSAMLQALAVSVFEHGEIVTTKVKAKQARRLIEHSISIAKNNNLASRRQLHRLYGRRDVVNNICERVFPALAAYQSGFTSMRVVGNRRGDNALVYQLSLVVSLPEKKLSPAKSKKEKANSKKVKTASSSGNDLKAQQAIKQDQKSDEKAVNMTNVTSQRLSNTRTNISKGRGK